MPKPKKTGKNIAPAAAAPAPEANDVVLKNEQSAVSEFVERNLPNTTETEEFEEFVQNEVRQSQIDAGLEEIYHDEDGNMVDVKTMVMKKGHGLIYRGFVTLLTLALIAGAGWSAYRFYLTKQVENNSSVSLSISGDAETLLGEEKTYIISYKNLDQVDLKNINIKATLPDNFIVTETQPQAATGTTWHIDLLGSKRSDQITIKGRIVGEVGQSAIFLATMSYQPANFSSEFSKEASFNSKISGLGLDLNFDYPSNVLVGETNAITVKYKAQDKSFVPNYRLSIEQAENIEIIGAASSSASTTSWQVASTTNQEKSLEIKFKFKQKTTDKQEINLVFEYTSDGQKYFTFLKKPLPFNVITKNLNLNLIINGSQNDQGVDFGQTLNYTITYANKGEAAMKEVVIMANLESDFLDWPSLADKNQGQAGNQHITWSKDQIPALADLAPGNEGTIDFSIKVKPAGDIDPTKNYQIKSYARFQIGASTSTDATSTEETSDRSNAITNKINSDLSLKEEIRYFNDDNIAVGSGPMPPKVGEATSYRVYWHLSNNLNELNELKITTKLPPYVKWDSRNRADVGAVSYDQATGNITWQIGRLPISVYKAEAEFSISILPTEEDKNKMLVLLPGSTIEAIDTTTQTRINKTSKAKTTKLEDDSAITDDGRVQ
ncbi:hypothetical protein HGA34_01150 [Candidatus Falkowbacteria bacterium]|nr:hypothetical protein [Candidatus Falkowbacteria bacterium]